MRGISIILPLYNKEDTIQKTIESIINLNDKCNKEIIIVDDGSTDRSLELSEKFLPHIKIITQKNRGPSAARNLGATHARYPYLVFWDADDELISGCLDEHLLMRSLNDGANITFVSFEIRYKNKIKNKKIHLNDRLKDNSEYILLQNLKFDFISYIHSGCFCINKDLFMKISGYDESLKLMEITDFLTRVFIDKPKAIVSNSILSIKNEGSSTSQFERASKDSEQIFLFGKKLLQFISYTDEEQKKLLAKEFVFTINKLWYAREFKKIKYLLYLYGSIENRNCLEKPSKKIMIVSYFFSLFR